MKKQYPAILTYKEGCEIAVTFPDLPGCATSGATEQDAITAGREALGLHLFGMEQDGDVIPAPSRVEGIELGDNEIAIMIAAGKITTADTKQALDEKYRAKKEL